MRTSKKQAKKNPFIQWLRTPHPMLVLNIIVYTLASIGTFYILPDYAQKNLMHANSIARAIHRFLVLSLIPSCVAMGIVHYILIRGGRVYNNISAEENFRCAGWNKTPTKYTETGIWLLYGFGWLYLSIASIIVGIASIPKWIGVATTETLRFALITLPTLVFSSKFRAQFFA